MDLPLLVADPTRLVWHRHSCLCLLFQITNSPRLGDIRHHLSAVFKVQATPSPLLPIPPNGSQYLKDLAPACSQSLPIAHNRKVAFHPFCEPEQTGCFFKQRHLVISGACFKTGLYQGMASAMPYRQPGTRASAPAALKHVHNLH